LRETVLGIFAFSGVSIMVVGGPLAVMVSFFVAYSIAGVAYFGPVLILFWASLVVGFVVIMEKSGKARHFEGKEFPLFRSLVAIPLAFLMVAGSFVLLLVLMHRI